MAKIAIARGDRVIATARSQAKLEELQTELKPEDRGRLRVATLDITAGEDAIKASVTAMAGFWGGIDILVNNAGMCCSSILP